jgi:hypothetical protein
VYGFFVGDGVRDDAGVDGAVVAVVVTAAAAVGGVTADDVSAVVVVVVVAVPVVHTGASFGSVLAAEGSGIVRLSRSMALTGLCFFSSSSSSSISSMSILSVVLPLVFGGSIDFKEPLVFVDSILLGALGTGDASIFV